MSDVDRLTNDDQAISALKRSALIYARRNELDARTLSKTVGAIARVEDPGQALPQWIVGDETLNTAEAGLLARRALEAMLQSPQAEGLHAAAADAIADEVAGKPHLFDPISVGVGGIILLALAFLSKWSWSKEGGHKFESGFPDLDKVLGKLGPIIGKLS